MVLGCNILIQNVFIYMDGQIHWCNNLTYISENFCFLIQQFETKNMSLIESIVEKSADKL